MPQSLLHAIILDQKDHELHLNFKETNLAVAKVNDHSAVDPQILSLTP